MAKLASITGSRWPVVGKRLVEQFPYIEAEIQYAVKEYASTIVDILARRTRLAFLNAEAAADAIPKIADIMARELKWSRAKKEVSEIKCFKINTLKNMLRGRKVGTKSGDRPLVSDLLFLLIGRNS